MREEHFYHIQQVLHRLINLREVVGESIELFLHARQVSVYEIHDF